MDQFMILETKLHIAYPKLYKPTLKNIKN